MAVLQKLLQRLCPLALLSLTLTAAQAPTQTSPLPANSPDTAFPSTAELQEARQLDTVLAGPDFRGRDARTGDESLAAGYVLGRLRALGLQPAGENGSFVQRFNLVQQRPDTQASRLSVAGRTAVYGQDYALNSLSRPLDSTVRVLAATFKTPADVGVFVRAHTRQLKNALVIVTLKPQKPDTFLDDSYNAALKKAGAAVTLTVNQVSAASPVWKTRTEKTTVLDSLGLADKTGTTGTVTPALAAKLQRAGQARLHLVLERKVIPAFNILARLPGRDPQAPALLLGSHLDHLGVIDGKIYPGADDNASGVTANLLAARLLSQGAAPSGDVYFAFWTGEEVGLLGSASFAAQPTFPLKRLRGYINIDMVGRNTTAPGLDDLMVLGYQWPRDPAASRQTLQAVLDSGGQKLEQQPYSPLKVQARDLLPTVGLSPLTGIVSLGGQRFDLRSVFYLSTDTLPFLQAGVPAVALSSGMHGDYHEATDTVDKVNFGKIVKVAHLLTRLAQDTKLAQGN